MSESLTGLIDFITFTHEVRKVKRAMWVVGEDEFENDSEHSFQLALTALYVIEQQKLKLDPYKAMSKAVVHDVLEAHSGDTPAFASKDIVRQKKEKEQAAIAKLKVQWPKLERMHALIEEYEHKTSAESRFVYALDKLIPIINNYLDGGRSWKRQHVSIQHVIEVKTGKVDIDETVATYYKDMLKLLKQKPELFV